MDTTRKQSPKVRALKSNREARARAAESLALARRRLEGLISRVEGDVPPLQLLIEVQAIKRPLREAVTVLLANHLHHCVIGALRSGSTAQIDEALDELVALYALTEKIKQEPGMRSSRT